MRKATKYLIVGAVALTTTLLLTAIISTALASTETTTTVTPPPSSSSPSPEPTATVAPPASAATVQWAKKWENAARRSEKKLNWARSCFGISAHRTSYRAPMRSDGEKKWMSYGNKMKHYAKKFDKKYKELYHDACYPGGSSSGERWVPLMLWLGYPRSIIPNFVYIITRESSGRCEALNSSSGAAGLLQFMPGWYHGQWGYPAFNPFDPVQNLTAGLHVWREEGFAPWAL